MALNLFLCAFAQGQIKEETNFNLTVEFIRSESLEKKKALFEHYAGAVEKLQTEFQSQGQLDNTLAAQTEARNARESMAFGKEEFPGVEKLREILNAELSKIEASEEKRLNQAREKYVKVLKRHISDLTKEGNLQEASRLNKVLEDTEAKLTARQAVEETPDVPESFGVLKQGEPLYGELTLSGGVHRLHEELQVGYRRNKTPDEQGFLTIQNRAEISGSSIWVNFGTLVASDTRFENVLIQEELQGKFSANRCLFDDCSFAKKGGWSVAWWGTKWEFNDCAIKGGFFERWTNARVGLKIHNCTFIDVDFPSFEMKEDALKETRSDWRTIDRCRFVDCEIPISVLLCITDSVFENCRFVEDDSAATIAVLNALNESILTKVFYKAEEEPKIPETSPWLKFDVKKAPTSMDDRGCSPFYELENGELRFK